MTAETFPPLGYDLLTFTAMLGFGFFGFLTGIAVTLVYVHYFPLSWRRNDREMFGPRGAVEHLGH